MAVTKSTVNDVKSRLGQGDDVQFVDARNPQAWGEANTRLPGAIRVPPDEPEKHLASVGRDRPVITYCTCPNEESSTRVAEVLEGHGYEDVHPLEGGFGAWRDAGMPVEPK
jgi:rhodanese-related sulfurtransferase